jgi:hypothetical protein
MSTNSSKAHPSPLPSVLHPFILTCAPMTSMGRTIPSFRIAAEMDRTNWRNFRSLLNLKDRKVFDQMFSYIRFYNSACMMQASPLIFHSVAMSILFRHYKQLIKLTDGRIKVNFRLGFHLSSSECVHWIILSKTFEPLIEIISQYDLLRMFGRSDHHGCYISYNSFTCKSYAPLD